MATYTGPVPTTPTGASSDAVWQSWWSYQNLLRDLRFEDERVARAAVLDRQHAERMAAEAACAQATAAAAASQRLLAENMLIPTPVLPRAWTDAELLLSFVENLLEAGKVGLGVMAEAKAQLTAYRSATAKPTPAPK